MRRPGRGSNRNNPSEPYDNPRQTRKRRGYISPETKSFAYGFGAGVLAMMLFPQMKDGLKPMAAGAVKGAVSIADKIQEMISEVREGVEDIVAEAKFENLKKSLDNDILKDKAEEAVKYVAGDMVKDVAEGVIKDVVEDIIL